jgi:predicted lipoprotein with Yx(FWY)xxD motif
MRPVRHRNEGNDKLIRSAPTKRVSASVALMAALGATGFLAAGSLAHGAIRTHATVSLRATELGRVLVNSRGHTLYLFVKDSRNKSACSGSCAKFWPPLLSHGKPTAGSGVRSSLLGTMRRSNGRLQVTYNKHPLYAYVLDRQAGQTNGEGNSAFGAKWYAVSAKGTAVIKAPTTTMSTTTTTTTSSCRYPPCP